jgi:hypothetical protein
MGEYDRLSRHGGPDCYCTTALSTRMRLLFLSTCLPRNLPCLAGESSNSHLSYTCHQLFCNQIVFNNLITPWAPCLGQVALQPTPPFQRNRPHHGSLAQGLGRRSLRRIPTSDHTVFHKWPRKHTHTKRLFTRT